MDKSIELMIEEWKNCDHRISELNAEVKLLKQHRSMKERALKALGWKVCGDGTAVEIAGDEGPVHVTQKHVREAALTAVKENPGITQANLEGFVNDKLSEDMQLDMKGIGLRWDEVWASGMFTVGEDDTVSITPTLHRATSMEAESNGSELPVESLAGFRKSH